MGKIQKFLIILVALALVLITILTWGSIGSIMTAFCLILMAGALLLRWHFDRHDPDDFRFDL